MRQSLECTSESLKNLELMTIIERTANMDHADICITLPLRRIINLNNTVVLYLVPERNHCR